MNKISRVKEANSEVSNVRVTRSRDKLSQQNDKENEPCIKNKKKVVDEDTAKNGKSENVKKSKKNRFNGKNVINTENTSQDKEHTNKQLSKPSKTNANINVDDINLCTSIHSHHNHPHRPTLSTSTPIVTSTYKHIFYPHNKLSLTNKKKSKNIEISKTNKTLLNSPKELKHIELDSAELTSIISPVLSSVASARKVQLLELDDTFVELGYGGGSGGNRVGDRINGGNHGSSSCEEKINYDKIGNIDTLKLNKNNNDKNKEICKNMDNEGVVMTATNDEVVHNFKNTNIKKSKDNNNNMSIISAKNSEISGSSDDKNNSGRDIVGRNGGQGGRLRMGSGKSVDDLMRMHMMVASAEKVKRGGTKGRSGGGKEMDGEMSSGEYGKNSGESNAEETNKQYNAMLEKSQKLKLRKRRFRKSVIMSREVGSSGGSKIEIGISGDGEIGSSGDFEIGGAGGEEGGRLSSGDSIRLFDTETFQELKDKKNKLEEGSRRGKMVVKSRLDGKKEVTRKAVKRKNVAKRKQDVGGDDSDDVFEAMFEDTESKEQKKPSHKNSRKQRKKGGEDEMPSKTKQLMQQLEDINDNYELLVQWS